MNPTNEPTQDEINQGPTFLWISGHFNRGMRRTAQAVAKRQATKKRLGLLKPGELALPYMPLPLGRTFNIGKRRMKQAARGLIEELSAKA